MNTPAIVLVTTSFPIAGDGSEAAGSFVSDIAEALAEHAPVRVVAPGRAATREAWSKDVELFRYAAPSKALSTLKPWQLFDTVRVLRGGLRATLEAVNAGPAKHIFALWALPSGEWARRASLATSVPYSVWTLGSDIWTLGRIPLVRTSLRRVLRDADFCYSDGLKLADDTRRIAGRDVEFLPSTRSIVANRERTLPAEPPYRLLFLGRWHHNKGVDILLDALEMLVDDEWSRLARVEIQGGGPMEPLVRERVGLLRERGRAVEVGGYLGKPEAEAAISRADWVLIPSRIESIPVIFSDAMKLGRPVIAMPVGDLPALYARHAFGVLAEGVSARMLHSAIRSALSVSAQSFAGNLHEQAVMFDLGALAGRIHKSLWVDH